MAFSSEQLNQIYDRTSGYCHICHKKLAFKNYGVFGARAAWEVEHSNPQAKGGTSRLNNLYPACTTCNRSKGASSTHSVRAKNGKSRAPLSTEKRKSAKVQNAVVGGAAGAAAGSILGPAGALVGALIGAHLGHKKNPDK
ncbi:MAG: HNH endonuclease [Sulfuricella sp.]|nr:HNH endonuclease [Sulfuricella sp.]